MIQLIQQGILLLGTLVGGVTDAKTGYIYDWITMPMIGIGLVLSVLAGMWMNVVFAAGIFVFLYIMYYFGKIGGGDVKLFVGIALLNPYNNAGFLAALAFFAAMSSMLFYSIFYSVKYARKGIDWEKNYDGIRQALILALIIAVYFAVLYYYSGASIFFIYLFGVPMLAGLVFVALQKGIKKEFFEKKINLKDLEEDEVIAENNSKKILDLFKTKGVIGEKEIKQMKKMKVKNIYVLRDLPPFGPFIFIGTMCAIYIPDFFILLFL